MGPSLSPAPTDASGARSLCVAAPAARLRLVRYRFFLYAGLLPYLLGAAWAYAIAGAFDATIFLERPRRRRARGRRRRGVQRVLRLAHGHRPRLQPGRPAADVGRGALARHRRLRRRARGRRLPHRRGGWPILAFALLGGAAAIFYVAPPIRWAYRGLGELVIALSYGPWMVLGSLYLHTARLSWPALAASLVPGCLIMALAVVNAIPDFHQDRLVGKRNLVVRLGRRRAVWLYLALSAAGLLVVPIGVVAGIFPWPCLAALLALPLLVESGRVARSHLRVAARLRAGGAQHRRLLPGRGAAAHRRHPRARRLAAATMNRIDHLGAPLFVSWQLTRDCDLCCLHCCTESAPGKRLPDELDADEAMRVADEIVRQSACPT